MRPAAAGALMLVLSSGGLSAQSPYVGATFIADIVRVSDFNDDPTGSREGYGGAIRVGAALGERWGLELEFARSSEAEAQTSFTRLLASPSPGSPRVTFIFLPFPIPDITATRQLTTLSPTVWWNQRLSDRASLVYHGGVAFTRVRRTLEQIDDPRILAIIGPIRAPTDSTSYDADVAVGLETRVTMTDHLRFTAGVRMQTAIGGWAIRPGVGLLWEF